MTPERLAEIKARAEEILLLDERTAERDAARAQLAEDEAKLARGVVVPEALLTRLYRCVLEHGEHEPGAEVERYCTEKL